MIDIHNHFLFGVDDGAKNLEETKKLLLNSFNQGVRIIFFTPHVNSSVSLASREIHMKNFIKTKVIAEKIGIQCFLGAEIYIPFRLPKIDYLKYQMGNSKTLLVEFSTYHETSIIDHVYNLKSRGFEIIIAHVERYNYLNIQDIKELKEIGAYLQVNASSIIKKNRSKNYNKAKKLIKNGFVDFIATDSHNLTSRPPNLLEAYQELRKITSQNQADSLTFNNAKDILLR